MIVTLLKPKYMIFWVALLLVSICGYAQPQDGSRQAGGEDTWLQRFNASIGSAYVLKPPSSFHDGPETGDVYIELVDRKNGLSELVAFHNKKSLGIGCFVEHDPEHEAPQHVLCQLQAHRKIDSNQLKLPECRLDINSKYSYRPGAKYFVSSQGMRAICVYAMPSQLDEYLLKEPRTSANDLLVMSIEPIWERNQQESNRPDNTGLLAHFFPSAPISQLSRVGLNGGRNCYDLPYSLSAFSTDKASNIFSANIPALRHPDFRWSYVYLVRAKKRISCRDAHYDIDVPNRPLAYGLADNTMLVRGQGSVLRIRVSDGSTDAPLHLVKRVQPQTFIETMQADGGAGCQSDNEKLPCKWLLQQGWYTYEKKYPDGNAGELFHSKFWFQGFDQAIKHIFFKQGE